MRTILKDFARIKYLPAAVAVALVAAVGVGAAGGSGDSASVSLPLTDQGRSPFVAVVQKVKEAVVNISAERTNRKSEWAHPLDPFFENLFPWGGGVPRQKSLGSGFLIGADGYILTNNHVIDGADKVTVRLSDKSEFAAQIVGADQATDLALLRIEAGHTLPYLEFGDSDSLLVGDWVIAIGNPFPQQGLDRTVTVGVVSALGRGDLMFGNDSPTYQNYIQTDASINPGNSGGPLINLRGEVVGINSAIASPTGANVGIGFAIPINFARLVVPELKSSGAVSRGWLGITPRDLNWDDVEAENLPSADGVLVNKVFTPSPADSAGLMPGDVIVAFNGEKVKDAQHFMRLVWTAKVSALITLSVIRHEKHFDLAVRLGDRDKGLAAMTPDSPAPSDSVTEESVPQWLGMEVETSTPQAAEQLDADYQPGVLVIAVEPGSPAYEKGIRPGMVIGEIDHQKIATRQDYSRIVSTLAERKKAVSLLVYDQQGNTGYIAIRPESN